MSDQGSCAVCGRTFLVGERVHSYVSAEASHQVCELCAGRAEEAGWLPAEQEGAEQTLRAERGHRPGLLTRLFGARGGDAEDEGARGDLGAVAGDPEGFVGDAEEPEALTDSPPAPHDLETERYDVEAEWAAQAEGTTLPSGPSADLPAPGAPTPPPAASAPSPPPPPDASPAPLPDPAGRGMRPRRLQPDLSPASRFERAIARFNAGDAGRTTAGLTRTLGAPSVSVGDLAGEGDVVRITVAWELTWYQWGVDLEDELRPAYELERGFELAEIDAAASQWNASAHDGRIVMVAPRGREAENGRPVHR